MILILVRSSTVRMEGLEPPHLTASDPKSDVSTNFTTSGRLFEVSGLTFDVFNLKHQTSNLKQLSFRAANVADFTQKKRLFLSKFAVHGYSCAVAQI